LLTFVTKEKNSVTINTESPSISFMPRNPSFPDAKSMDKNWKIAFGDVIQERNSKQKRWIIIVIFSLCLLFLAYAGMVLSAQLKNMIGTGVSGLIILLVPIILIIGALYLRRGRYLYGMDVLYYNLYEITNLFEKYQKPDETLTTKNELYRQIKILLKESSSYVRSYEDQANRYVYPDYEKESLLFFSKNFYYFNHIIKNKQFPIPDDVLKTIKDNCDAHMKLRIRNHTDFTNLQNLSLQAWKLVSIPEYTVVRENKWLKFFINRTLLEKFLIYSVINTLFVGAFFYFAMPVITGLAKESLINNGIYVWGIFEGGIFLILWSNRGISGT